MALAYTDLDTHAYNLQSIGQLGLRNCSAKVDFSRGLSGQVLSTKLLGKPKKTMGVKGGFQDVKGRQDRELMSNSRAFRHHLLQHFAQNIWWSTTNDVCDYFVSRVPHWFEKIGTCLIRVNLLWDCWGMEVISVCHRTALHWKFVVCFHSIMKTQKSAQNGL